MTGSIPIVSIVGRSGSGKTTLIEKLIGELKARGYRLAVVKHHYHVDFAFDVPGKDSYRFAHAGADHVAVAGPATVVHVRQLAAEPTLEEVVADIRDVDLIITEGYKRATTPKIVVSRSEQGPPELVVAPEQVIAIVSDQRFDVPAPHFGLDDVEGIADLIAEQFPQRAR